MANKGIPQFPLFDLFLEKMSCPLFGVPTVFKSLVSEIFPILVITYSVSRRFVHSERDLHRPCPFFSRKRTCIRAVPSIRSKNDYPQEV